jgi:4a-hydroxytetrahydrobiopterin dehydratase
MTDSTLTTSEITESLADTAFMYLRPTLYATFSTEDFASATEFVTRVAKTADAMNHHPEVRLGFGSVAFELSSHDAGGVTNRDLELARHIQAIADEVGASAVPTPIARYTLAIDTVDPAGIRDFWRVGMGYVEAISGDQVEMRDPRGIAPTVWFQRMQLQRPDRNRIHVDVYVPTPDAPARVQAVLAAGGTLVTDEFAPDWWVLADADGNELCICTAD